MRPLPTMIDVFEYLGSPNLEFRHDVNACMLYYNDWDQTNLQSLQVILCTPSKYTS